MGKVTFCEELSIEHLQSSSQDGQFAFGLLIGHVSEKDNVVLHMAPFPVMEVVDDEGQAHENSMPKSLAAIPETAVTSHANQVSRMLPGGIDVVGLYSVLDSSDINKSLIQQKIKLLLHAVNKAISKQYLGIMDDIYELLFISKCTKTSKIGVKYFDMNDVNPSMVSGEVKSISTNWIEIDYTYDLSQKLILNKESNSQALSKNVSALLQPWAAKIAETLILIDGKLRSDEELLCSFSNQNSKIKQTLGGANRSQISIGPPLAMHAEFLEKTIHLTGDASLQEVSSSIAFSGRVAGRAFLAEKATVKEAFDALRKDLVRSLVSRWEMHCDSLIEEPPGSSTGSILHEPPRRVFLEGGGLPISLCDYLFPGDTATDACLSAKELLGISVLEENVDTTQEVYSDPSEILDSSPISPSSPGPFPASNPQTFGNINYIYFLSFLVAILSAFALNFILSQQSKR